jgi:biopolymer transport protein TolR
MSDINMTPLVDVMLVLVVIFIITAPLLVSAVKVDLPKAAGAAALEAPKFIAITLDRSGQVYVDDQPLDAQALSVALRRAAERQPDTEVRLRADAAVPYGRVVEVMGQAHLAGLHRIGFVADTAVAAH